MPASTVTMPADTFTDDALTVTAADAVTVMPPLASSMRLPLLSSSSTLPGPSASVSFWPPGVSSVSVSVPAWSSSVMVMPFFVRRRLVRFSPPRSMSAGDGALPFHSPPTISGARRSPWANSSSTSSSTSGRQNRPRSLPAIGATTRAHNGAACAASVVSDNSATCTRLRCSGSSSETTRASKGTAPQPAAGVVDGEKRASRCMVFRPGSLSFSAVQ